MLGHRESADQIDIHPERAIFTPVIGNLESVHRYVSVASYPLRIVPFFVKGEDPDSMSGNKGPQSTIIHAPDGTGPEFVRVP